MQRIAENASPRWRPEQDLPEKALGFRIQEYGMLQWADLFTDRQLAALTTFSIGDLSGAARSSAMHWLPGAPLMPFRWTRGAWLKRMREATSVI